MNILVINPGGTSSKIAVYNRTKNIFNINIKHTQKDLEGFKTVFDQYSYRRDLIEKTLRDNNFQIRDFTCIVSRGGMMKPIEGGTYLINGNMIKDLKSRVYGEHASNVGALIAKKMGDDYDLPAFVVDPVSVDEMMDISRITGIKDLTIYSLFHALNQKAVCRKIASTLGGKYEDFNFLVAHLGSGVSVVAHRAGRMIDGSGGRISGPFSPERAGSLPSYPLIELCYSQKYSHEEMVAKVSTKGGFYDYLRTKDIPEIEDRVKKGDQYAKLILDAFIYQVSKEIAMFSASLYGRIDRIIITGGIAYSDLIFEGIRERVGYLSQVIRVPGEMEMEALAYGALRVITGQEKPKEY